MLQAPNGEKCQTCKYWDNKDIEKELEDPYGYSMRNVLPKTGLCIKATEIWNVSEWKENEETEQIDRSLLPEYKDLKMFTQDGSSFRATLITMFDFFCYHYEKKD